jgi:hypothetical protein
MALSGICASGGTHIPAMFIQCLSVALAPRPRALPFCKCLDHGGRSISQGPVLYMKKGGAVDKRPAQFIEVSTSGPPCRIFEGLQGQICAALRRTCHQKRRAALPLDALLVTLLCLT